MLKYKFKTYYPRSVVLTTTLTLDDHIGSRKLYELTKINGELFYKINLSNCVQSFTTRNDYWENFNTLTSNINKFTIPQEGVTLDSIFINQFFTGLTDSMFLKQIEKHKELLKSDVYIYNNDRIINFDVPMGAPGFKIPIDSTEENLLNGIYHNSKILRNGAYLNKHINEGLCILIKQNKTSLKDYDELIFLYLKCALICAKKTYEYENLISCLQNKISAPKITSIWMNSIKRIGLINIEQLKLKSINCYSKNKSNENIYLNIDRGCFISNFDTYSNLKSIEENDTLVGVIKSYYEDKIVKNKIIISNNILEYFTFLKKNRKNEIYSNDYNKLNKVLNAIKSLAIMHTIEIEFGDIEQDIYNIEISITRDNLMEVFDYEEFNLIPKNIQQAIELKSIYEDLLSQIQYSKEIYSKYLFSPGSIFSPLSGATMKEMEDELIYNEMPF